MAGVIKLLQMTRSQRSQERFYAKFDNGEGFTVTIAMIADYGLFSGKELSQSEYQELKGAAGLSKAKGIALRMLSARPMSKGEIIERLMRKGQEECVAEAAAQWLCDIGAVDDEEYSRMIVAHYSGKGYGIGKIRDELYKRKIPRHMWEDALAHMPETEENIDRLVRSKLKGGTPDRKEINKLSGMLLRRGFSYDEIRSALRRYEESFEE